MRQALQGLKVVELGELISGPYCAKLLGDFGAEVVKVEEPGFGDPARRRGPFLRDIPNPEGSGLFLYLNTNKLGVTLDVSARSERAIMETLLGQADIFVTNLSLSRLEACGLNPVTVSRRFPNLIAVAITPFGLEGPYRAFKAYDIQISAAGAVSVTIGDPKREPLRLPLAQCDYQAGVAAANGALLALLAREVTGRGQVVDVAAAHVMGYHAGVIAGLYHYFDGKWVRASHRSYKSGGWYPYTILPCKDGYVCLMTRSGHPWKRFVEAIGSPEWSRDPRYQDRARMGRDYPDEVDALLQPWLMEHTREEILTICRERSIPFAAVRTIDEVARCAHLEAREFFVNVLRPEAGPVTLPGSPFKLSETPWRLIRPAPRLGEHNRIVFGRPPAIPSERPATFPEASLGMTDPSGRYPLEGLRVLDFGWVGVVPAIGSFLADLGAEVIKVESRKRLDYCRLIPAPIQPEKGEDHATAMADGRRAESIDVIPLFHNFNRGKLSITIDLRHPRALPLMKALVRRSDAVIENFASGVMDRLGLGYAALRDVRPDLVMLSAPAGGQWGPLRDLRTFAPSLLAVAGLQSLIGYAGERVLGELLYGYSDFSNAQHGAFALLVALYHRSKTGQGQYIDLAQLESTAGLAAEALVDYFMNGRVAGPRGNYDPTMAPHGNYPCRGEDQWVAIAVGDDAEWEAFRVAVGSPEWSRDARFARRDARVLHRLELDARVAEWTAARTPWEATEILQAAGVAAFPVYGLEDLERDPQLRERGLYVDHEDGALGRYRLFQPGWRLRDTPGGIRRSAPRLGEHNHRVLVEILGCSPGEVEALRAEGVLT